MKIYNTLTQSVEELTSPDKKLNMFVCGPTVYDHIHTGNARTFVVFDMIAKYLRHRGFDVDYIQNITDLDDKIIKRAQEQNRDPLDFAREYEEKFKKEVKAIGVNSPRYERATDYIPQITNQVKTLIDKGNAYLIEGDGWYFDLSTFPEYGKLSKRTTQMADDGVSRIDENANKRNTGDFCLWKLSKSGEPAWNFESGEYLGIIDAGLPAEALAKAGRPGWHIEDTAITEANFGSQYDIHGGGRDLLFPHHEAELTQMESISGKKPFVRYWMHAGFLENKSAKMSKSLDNFTKLNELLEKYSREAVRFFFLSAHYRAPLDFSDQGLIAAEAAVQRIYEAINRVNNLELNGGGDDTELKTVIEKARGDMRESLDDDFNTPEALASLFDVIRAINVALIQKNLTKSSAEEIKQLFSVITRIFDIIPTKGFLIPGEIQNLVDQREKARQKKDFTSADQLREQIDAAGFSIDDTPYGPLIKRRK